RNENAPAAEKKPNIYHRWSQRLLRGTYHHYLAELPGTKGIMNWIIVRFFTGIVIEPGHLGILRGLPQDAITVYSLKFKSLFDFLFFHTRYRTEKLRPPEIGFGYRFWLTQPFMRLLRSAVAQVDWLIRTRSRLDPYTSGYWRQELLKGRAAILPLVEKRGFYRRFVKAKTDPLLFLIELQKSVDRPVCIIPHLIFFSKSPATARPRLRDILFGSERRPRMLRRLFTMFRHPGKVFAEVSEPLNLQQFLARPEIQKSNPEYQALMLRRQLLVQHNRHRQSITGPIVKSHEELKESILTNERLRQFMATYAESRKEMLLSVRRQADGYLDEIAAKYSFSFINIIAGPIGWLLNTMFDGTVVDSEDIQRLKIISQKGSLVLVPCHKSHIDYLILSYILFQHNMPCPHIAAGKNLSFWPLGPFFRAGGAFFLRRTFRGAVLYSKVFAEYIHKLLEEGFNLELFIEGGRSRSGKLLIPKLGFLTILLNAFRNGACDDINFVPVFIGYDQVLEEDAYLHELEGGKKEPENISQVLRARRFLKRRYGKIYINFHESISLNQVLREYGTTLAEMPQKTQNVLCRDLGWRIINAIDQSSIVTPHALVAAAILNAPARRFTISDIMDIVDIYMLLLQAQNTRFADTMLVDHHRACEQALENYVQRKIIELPSGEKTMPGELAEYVLPTSKRLQLEYYKNNCVSYFVTAALTATAILGKDAFQFSASDLHDRFRFLQDFFKYEFAYDNNKPAEDLVRKTLKAFIDQAILMPHATMPDTYQITSAGFRKLKLFGGFLKTYFESYWVVLQHFKTAERSSKINYNNGISFFTTHQVKGSQDLESIEFYEQTIRHFITCLSS
ncbi:MAG: 1-acyl-sn-glycerol-3-phosphate acyltransferase, partial [Desulfosarcinaceae bacterium]